MSEIQFEAAQQPAGKSLPAAIGRLAEVPVEVAVEIGRATMTIGETLALGPGSIVSLDRLAGEPLDLLVNGKAIARGEVVVIDEQFGLRVTEIVTPAQQLGEGDGSGAADGEASFEAPPIAEPAEPQPAAPDAAAPDAADGEAARSADGAAA
ncbi:MAG: flagellar motor switch protein FliN [Thermoleophilaceae bacterium]|nr:flagellar motor switch protein FliN [Thermoleophilaceae bacterium]